MNLCTKEMCIKNILIIENFLWNQSNYEFNVVNGSHCQKPYHERSSFSSCDVVLTKLENGLFLMAAFSTYRKGMVRYLQNKVIFGFSSWNKKWPEVSPFVAIHRRNKSNHQPQRKPPFSSHHLFAIHIKER